jgi:GT2 family glycosyltransferase
MFSFVILHYKTIDETLKCLKCLYSTFEDMNISTIVVDNNTLNIEDEGKIKNYTEDIIKLEENVGFAKANNIGCKYAINKYNPEFICVINNDVFITQKEFIEYVENDYTEFNFDMLGPFIESRTGESINPFPNIGNKEDIINYINRTKKLIKIYKNPLLYYIFNITMNIKHKFNKPIIPTNGEYLKTKCCLHCCAIIFSKKYIEKYNEPFNGKTFLFHEEEFLYNRVLKDKLISVYDPKIKVYHQEGSSMNNNKNTRLNKLFKEKEKLKSLEMLAEEV